MGWARSTGTRQIGQVACARPHARQQPVWPHGISAHRAAAAPKSSKQIAHSFRAAG